MERFSNVANERSRGFERILVFCKQEREREREREKRERASQNEQVTPRNQNRTPVKEGFE